MARQKSTRKRSRLSRRYSTSGKIMAPIDVRTENSLSQMAKRIFKGPLTVMLVYADWCGHCHDFMPKFDKACKNKGRSVQAIKVNETMMDKVNSTIKRQNSSAKGFNVSGYPTILLVDKNGNALTEVPKPSVEKVMNQAGPIAEKANSMNVSGNMASASPSPMPSPIPSPSPSASLMPSPSPIPSPSPMKPAVSSFKPNVSPMSNTSPFPKSMEKPVEKPVVIPMEVSMENPVQTPIEMDTDDGFLSESDIPARPKISPHTGGSLYKNMSNSLYRLAPSSILYSKRSKRSTKKVHFRKRK